MAIKNTSKNSSPNRYSGTDSIGWKVRGTDGKNALSDSFKGYVDADAAAKRYTEQTGLYAEAVRS